MNGAADMGGMHGFGPVVPEPNEPVFHGGWEKRVLGFTVAMGATGGYFQQVPSTHGANIAGRYGVRTYRPPFPDPGPVRFPPFARTFRVRQPIVAYQQRVADFFTSAFAGNAQITVTGIEPLYDMDDDGWTDAEERSAATDPYDPSVHPAGAMPHVRDVGF